MSENNELSPVRAGVGAARWIRGVLVGAVGLVAALAGTGCVATVGPEPVYVASSGAVYSDGDIAYADTVPADIYAYPTIVYGGVNVYWVNGYWYYPYAGRWAMYRSEPPFLYRQRVSWGYYGPNYYGGYYGGYYGTHHHGHYNSGHVNRGPGYQGPSRNRPDYGYQGPSRNRPDYRNDVPARPAPAPIRPSQTERGGSPVFRAPNRTPAPQGAPAPIVRPPNRVTPASAPTPRIMAPTPSAPRATPTMHAPTRVAPARSTPAPRAMPASRAPAMRSAPVQQRPTISR
ncbi:hypothetical protein [Chondromyces apiculatus]|uniref:hypothetical protein n=1 Tax=Chondromyces apiculatus TaxID=51 RepID=UPI0018CC2452|nr:hypothetical protein [Chondromyces apiculatus]